MLPRALRVSASVQQPPLLEIRPNSNFLPFTLARLRANPSLLLMFGIVVLGGAGSALAFGHRLNAFAIIAIIGISLLGVIAVFGWLFVDLSRTRWRLYPTD